MEMKERLILTRQALYRFYAGLLLYPESDRLETLRGGAGWLSGTFQDAELCDELQIKPLHRDLVEWVAGFYGDLDAFQAEWVRLFGSSRDGYCFPYEGAYQGAEAAGPLMAKLQKEYARSGLAMSGNDLPDHISVELEYMSYLCGLELETLRSREDERRGRIVKAQYLFLENHLCQWLPILRERVTTNKGGPFADICQAASDMVVSNRNRLSTMVEESAGSMV